jgi:cell volume regulation protein A
MTFSVEIICIAAGLLLLLGTLLSKISGRFGVPALVLFLLLGMVAGSEGIGGIPFDDAAVAQTLGILALVVILFSGGLDTGWKSVRPVMFRALSLATIGVGITAAIVGGVAAWILHLPLIEGILIGAIVSSTDAAAVLAVLRTANLRLKKDIQPLLELESGSNDPMAVFLTTALTGLIIHPATGIGSLLMSLVLQMVIGAAAGFAIGRASVWLINRLDLEIEGLYPVLTLSLALLTFGLSSELLGNGFLAVYVAGIVLGNGDIVHRRSLMRFHEGLAWLMQIVMFVMLGLLVFPSHLPAVAGAGLLLAIVLILARPVSVMISLALSKMGGRQKLFISWVGLRGAVPIILATFPMLSGVPDAELIFDLVFFIVLVSVLLQGTTVPVVARWLKLGEQAETRHRSPIEFEKTGKGGADLLEMIVPHTSPVAGRQLNHLGLPHGALVVLISRADEFLVAQGNTVLREGDVLLVLADRHGLREVEGIISPWSLRSTEPGSAEG